MAKEYRVYDSGERRLIDGTAESILKHIKERPTTIDNDIDGLTLKEYADSLIDNSTLFLPTSVVQEISSQYDGSAYDQALSLLSAMPSSGTHIVG